MSRVNENVEQMLEARTFAVVGASTNPEKYGYIAYKDLKAHGKTVYPINPRAREIDGDGCYSSVSTLPEVPHVVVAVVPPTITEKLVDELITAGVQNVWMQPGAESTLAIQKSLEAGINVVAGGPCIMVGLRTHSFKKS